MRSDPTAAFLRWAFLRSALARGWWLTTALYLVVVADLSPFQLVLIGVFQGLMEWRKQCFFSDADAYAMLVRYRY